MDLDVSILNSTKKKLGLNDAYDEFDQDVIDYINSSFFGLYKLGLGPADGYEITGPEETWEDFDSVGLAKPVLNAVKTYITLKVRLLFDPPGTPHHITAMEEQIRELEYTLLRERDLALWAPTPASSSPSLP